MSRFCRPSGFFVACRWRRNGGKKCTLELTVGAHPALFDRY
jgi:hypothetical protein